MSEFLGKLLLGFFTGVIFPIIMELWKAHRLSNSAPVQLDELVNTGSRLVKAVFRVIVAGFAGLGATALVNEYILHVPRMPHGLVGYIMVMVFSVILWRFWLNR